MIRHNKPLVAIIAEGGTEQAIIEVLIKHRALKYHQNDLLNESVIRCRSGKSFARKYLNKSFGCKIKVIRILDSRQENFKLPLAYQRKVSNVVNVYTRPEIEILFIIKHHDYRHFTNHVKIKPSSYARQHYKDLKGLKSHSENFDFWDNHFSELLECLREYKRYSSSSEKCIFDLLKREYQ